MVRRIGTPGVGADGGMDVAYSHSKEKGPRDVEVQRAAQIYKI